jgi:hypothetical protein
MPAPVEETDIDSQFTSAQRQERRGVLMNMLRHDWIIRFPEDEFDDHEDEDDIAKEKVMKGNYTAPAIHPLPHHLVAETQSIRIYSLRRIP